MTQRIARARIRSRPGRREDDVSRNFNVMVIALMRGRESKERDEKLLKWTSRHCWQGTKAQTSMMISICLRARLFFKLLLIGNLHLVNINTVRRWNAVAIQLHCIRKLIA